MGLQNNTSKGQSSAEILIIFGIAILITVVVIITVLDIPVTFESSFSREDALYFSTLPVAIISTEESGSGTVFYLRNNLYEGVIVTGLSADGVLGGIVSTPLLPGGIRAITAGSLPYQKGSKQQIHINYTLNASNKAISYASNRDYYFS